MKLQVVSRADAPALQWQTYPTALDMMRIEVHYCDNDVGSVLIGFGVGDDLFAIGVKKLEPTITLQCRMRPACVVQPGDEFAHVTAVGHFPLADLIFFRIQIFLAA